MCPCVSFTWSLGHTLKWFQFKQLRKTSFFWQMVNSKKNEVSIHFQCTLNLDFTMGMDKIEFQKCIESGLKQDFLPCVIAAIHSFFLAKIASVRFGMYNQGFFIAPAQLTVCPVALWPQRLWHQNSCINDNYNRWPMNSWVPGKNNMTESIEESEDL